MDTGGRKKVMDLRQLVNTNFTWRDLHVTLTYDSEHLPKTEEEAERNFRNWLERVARRCKKLGLPPPKYIGVTEHQEPGPGRKGVRYHHHAILSCGLNRDELESLWHAGRGRKRFERMGTANADRLQLDKGKRLVAGLGYAADWRELVAADFGAATSRKRFFLIARKDGRALAWPNPMHAPAGSSEVSSGRKKAWRSAAEIIDWSLPCPSIFSTKEQIKEEYGVNAVRPLADNTLRRIARGMDKFVLKSPEPFIVQTNHKYEHFRGQHTAEPLKTITAKNQYGVVEPTLAPCIMCNNANNVGAMIGEPVPKITTGNRNFLTSAALVQYHTEQNEDVRGQSVEAPLGTVDTSNRYGVAAASLVKYYGVGTGQTVGEPAHTVTTKDREALAVAFLEVHHAGGYHGKGNSPDIPLNTITTSGGISVNMAHVIKFKGNDIGQHPQDPLHTVTTSAGEFASCRTYLVKVEEGIQPLYFWPQIRELLNKYCGYTLRENEVLIIELGGAPHFVADIGLRMLTPRELYSAQGFPEDYIIDMSFDGKAYGKSKQVARCGNAVPPPFATALVRANAPEWCEGVHIASMREWDATVTA